MLIIYNHVWIKAWQALPSQVMTLDVENGMSGMLAWPFKAGI